VPDPLLDRPQARRLKPADPYTRPTFSDRTSPLLGSVRAWKVLSSKSASDPVPPHFFVHDPDGNRFLIVEVG
jgi:catechol 2,3-dioxygenase-like lactoylglutathione lyase family enzyme